MPADQVSLKHRVYLNTHSTMWEPDCIKSFAALGRLQSVFTPKGLLLHCPIFQMWTSLQRPTVRPGMLTSLTLTEYGIKFWPFLKITFDISSEKLASALFVFFFFFLAHKTVDICPRTSTLTELAIPNSFLNLQFSEVNSIPIGTVLLN